MQIPTRILLTAAALAAFQTARAQSAPASAPTPAPATAETVKLEPVRVTSDLWEAPLARIPASVTVYDEQALRDGAVKHFGDLVDEIPNLTWSGGTSRPRYFQIRGIGENSQFEGETPDSTVRFLVDDLDFTGLGTMGSTFDLHQVEVLRGPQAGAYGANAAGGLVRLQTNAPTPFWMGRVEANAGGDKLREGGFAVGGPLTPGNPNLLMARLAIQESKDDGFRRNLTVKGDTNARDEFNARLRFTANPSPLWRFDSTILYSDLHNGYDEFALDNNGKYTYSDQPGVDNQRSKAASLRATFTGIEGVRFTSVTSGTWVDSRYSYDDDWTAASYASFSDLTRDRAVFNQEVRFDSTATHGALGWIDRWTVGAYYANTKEHTNYSDSDAYGYHGLKTRYGSDNVALFGQVSHDITPSTRLVVGLRTESVSLDGRGTKQNYDSTTKTFTVPITFHPGFDGTLFGGKVTLEHDLSANEIIFASVTRGYKAGGINIDARIKPPADPLTYGTETMWNYEAGIRGNWLEHQLTGELTAFYLDRHNAQVRDSAGFGGSYRFFTANGHGSDVYGLEASAKYALTKELSLHATLAQMGSRLDAFTLSNGNTGGDRRLANTPRYGYTLGVSHHDASGFFANAELVGRAEQFDSNNGSEARRPFSLVNASVGYTWQAWTFTVWGRNIFNKDYQKRVYFFGNEDPDYIETRYEDRADPRQVGVSAAWRF